MSNSTSSTQKPISELFVCLKIGCVLTKYLTSIINALFALLLSAFMQWNSDDSERDYELQAEHL